MIRKFSRLFAFTFTTSFTKLTVPKKLNGHKITTVNLCSKVKFGFCKLPAHQVLSVR